MGPRRAAAGAVFLTASLMSAYAAALRALPTYASTPAAVGRAHLHPRTLDCPAGSTEVGDDTTLQLAVASSDDREVICLTADITLSSTLELDDTSVTLIGGTAATTLTAPAGSRHIYAKFDDTQQDMLAVQSLTLVGGHSADGGGSIYMKGQFKDSMDLRDDTFTRNSADGNGGAVYATAPDDIEIQALSIIMTDDSGAAGGALAIHSDSGPALILLGGLGDAPAIFSDDTATSGDGGAIFASTHDGAAIVLAIANSQFTHTSAMSGNGGAIATHADLVTTSGSFPYVASSLALVTGISGVGTPHFTYVEASDQGGAVYSNGMVWSGFPFVVPESYLTGGVFEHNHAQSGGAIAAPATVAMSSRFSHNSADDSGGAISVDDTGYFMGRYVLFEDDSAQLGGAIYAASTSTGSVTIEAATFDSNYSATSGGAIATYVPTSITNSTFTSNVAGGAIPGEGGGAVYSDDSLNINFTTITGNAAPLGYGAGVNAVGDLSVSNSILWRNEALDDSDVFAPGSWAAQYSLITSPAYVSAPDDSIGTIYAQDPQLGPLRDNGGAIAGDAPTPTMLPAWDGPVAAAASDDSAGFPQFDERGTGFLRWVAPRADLGATQFQMSVDSLSPTSGPVRGQTEVSIVGSGFTHATGVSFGSAPALSFTVVDDGHITAVTPASAAGTVDVTVVVGPHSANRAHAFAFVSPRPPALPGAPREVTATADDAAAVVSWLAPTSSGSTPVTGYRVTASPGGAECTTAQLTCRVTGLTNGTSYTFTVEASNSAGYGTKSVPSNAVTPSAKPVEKTIIITGSRDSSGKRPTVTVDGVTTGLVGQVVTPHVRFPGQDHYRTGKGIQTVDADGAFHWSRTTGKKTYVYFTGAGVRSNRVIIEQATTPASVRMARAVLTWLRGLHLPLHLPHP